MEISQLDREMARRVFEDVLSRQKTNEDIFYDLIFCICAPQTTFIKNRAVIASLRNQLDFYHHDIPTDILQSAMRPTRFYKNKTKWILEAKAKFNRILEELQDAGSFFGDRIWLVKNVRGLGMKAASHFLRNMGAMDLAIIDVHILKFMNVNGKWNYLALEQKFRRIAETENLSVAELDMIVWKQYSNTPWEKFTQ